MVIILYICNTFLFGVPQSGFLRWVRYCHPQYTHGETEAEQFVEVGEYTHGETEAESPGEMTHQTTQEGSGSLDLEARYVLL